MRTSKQTFIALGLAGVLSLSTLITPLTALATPVNAQLSEFEAITGKDKGYIGDEFNDVSLAPYNDSVAIVARIKEPRLLSLDNGASWKQLDIPLSWGQVKLFASADGSTLALLDINYGSNALYLSRDRGVTWEDVASIPFAESIHLETMAMSSDGQSFTVTSANNMGEPVKIYRSTDGAASWQTSTLETPAGTSVTMSEDGATLAVRIIGSENYYTSPDRGATWEEVDFQGLMPDYVMSPSGRTILGTSSGAEFVTPISRDHGATWTATSGLTDIFRIYSVTELPDETTLHLTAQTSTTYELKSFVSVDSGLTWSERTLGPGIQPPQSQIYAADRLHGITNSTIGSVAKTTSDGGITWTPQLAGYRAEHITISGDGRHLTVAGYNTGDYDRAIFTSSDYGVSWQRATHEGYRQWNNVYASATGTTVAATIMGTKELHVSTDGGATWNAQSNTDVHSWSDVQISNNGSVIVGFGYTASYIKVAYLSADGGASWQRILPDAYINRFIGMTNDGSHILLDTSDGLYETKDRGSSWHLIATPDELHSHNGTTFASKSGTAIVYGAHYTDDSDHGLLFVKERTSTQWLKVTTELDTVNSVTVSSDGGTYIVEGSENDNYTVLLSTDKGASWRPVAPAEADSISRASVTFDGKIILLSGTDTEEISTHWISSDQGITWRTIQPPIGHSMFVFEGVQSTETGTLVLSISDFTIGDGASRHFVSADTGETWNEIDTASFTQEDASFTLKIAPTLDGRHLFAIDAGRQGHVQKASFTSAISAPTLAFTPHRSAEVSAPTSTNPLAPQRVTNNRPHFSGNAKPFAAVTVTVNSDPIVCTAIADNQGNWSCPLPSDIPAGAHSMRVQFTDAFTDGVQTSDTYYIELQQNGTPTDTGSGTNAGLAPGAPNTGLLGTLPVASSTQAPSSLSHVLLLGLLAFASLVSLVAACGIIRRNHQ